jgi:hypothetical protein
MKQKSEVAEAADFYFAVPSGRFPLFKNLNASAISSRRRLEECMR